MSITMESGTAEPEERVNGLDVAALKQVIEDVKQDPGKASVGFAVRSVWEGQTRSVTRVDGYTLAGQDIRREFAIAIDEPTELLGTDSAPNPQEMLMAALNACMIVGYVAGAAMRGITLEKLEIETAGALDLRGFLGLDDTIPPGYEALKYTVRVKGDGSPEAFREIHERVMETSPNYFNVARPIRLDADLVVES